MASKISKTTLNGTRAIQEMGRKLMFRLENNSNAYFGANAIDAATYARTRDRLVDGAINFVDSMLEKAHGCEESGVITPMERFGITFECECVMTEMQALLDADYELAKHDPDLRALELASTIAAK